jgi:hypothetical protein
VAEGLDAQALAQGFTIRLMRFRVRNISPPEHVIKVQPPRLGKGKVNTVREGER